MKTRRVSAVVLQINHDIDLNTPPLVAFYKGCLDKDSRSRGVNTPLLLRWLRGQVRWTMQLPDPGTKAPIKTQLQGPFATCSL